MAIAMLLFGCAHSSMVLPDGTKLNARVYGGSGLATAGDCIVSDAEKVPGKDGSSQDRAIVVQGQRCVTVIGSRNSPAFWGAVHKVAIISAIVAVLTVLAKVGVLFAF